MTSLAYADPTDTEEEAERKLYEIARNMHNPILGVRMEDRRYRLKTYHHCFLGNEAVDWLVANLRLDDRDDAVRIGEALMKNGFIFHVTDSEPFLDAPMFYEFRKKGEKLVDKNTGFFKRVFGRRKRQAVEEEDLVFVRCRICEETVVVDVLERHSRDCVARYATEEKIVKTNALLTDMLYKLNHQKKKRSKSKNKALGRARSNSTASNSAGGRDRVFKQSSRGSVSGRRGSLGRRARENAEPELEVPQADAFDDTLDLVEKLTHLAIGIDHRDRSALDHFKKLDKQVAKAVARTGSSTEKALLQMVQHKSTLVRKYAELIPLDVIQDEMDPRVFLSSKFKAKAVPSKDQATDTLGLPSIHDFEVMKLLAKGGFGKVYLTRKIATGDLYAMKVIRKREVTSDQVKNIMAEKEIMASVHHPNLVRMYYSFQTDKHLFFIMEYLPGGDMYMLLNRVGRLKTDLAKQFLAEMVLAIEHLHGMGTVHRDLKPDNLLLTATGHLKITDFGLSNNSIYTKNEQSKAMVSRRLPRGKSLRSMMSEVALDTDLPKDRKLKQLPRAHLDSMVGTPNYAAPEVLRGEKYDYAVDWWAVGAIAFEFMTGFPPFFDEDEQQVYRNILDGRVPWPKVPDQMSQDAYDFVSGLLTQSPSKRLGHQGADEIKAHPYFSGVEWETVATSESLFQPELSDELDTQYFETDDLAEAGKNILAKDLRMHSMLNLNDAKPVGSTRVDAALSDFAHRDLQNLSSLNRQVTMKYKNELRISTDGSRGRRASTSSRDAFGLGEGRRSFSQDRRSTSGRSDSGRRSSGRRGDQRGRSSKGRGAGGVPTATADRS